MHKEIYRLIIYFFLGVDHPEMRIIHGIQVIRWLRNTSVDAFSFGSACNLGCICSRIRIIRTLTATTTHTRLTRPYRKPLNFFYTTFATLENYSPRDIWKLRITFNFGTYVSCTHIRIVSAISTFPLVNGISNFSKTVRITYSRLPIGSY
jgi:hypothetical protein